jgi:hypothetical protein
MPWWSPPWHRGTVLLHDRRVDAERDVVDEEPVADRCVVDATLDGVAGAFD